MPTATQRRVVLHAGLHKTGTTALQSTLFRSGDELRRNGFIYPHAGALEWLGGGHHNIAWELTADRRQQVRFGTIDDVAREIADSGLHAILSTEDFESVIGTPERFVPLRDHPVLRHHQFSVIFYVRNQIDYLESLYFEMLHHGVGAGLQEFAEPLFSGGRVVFRDWVFHFDYAKVYSRLVEWGRMQVIVRDYHHLNDGSVIADFLGQIGIEATGGLACAVDRVNPRDRISDSLRMFFTNRQGRGPSPLEMETISHISNYIGDRPVVLSTRWRELVARLFKDSNRQLCLAAGLNPDGLMAQPPTSTNAVALERLFEPHTHHLILTTPAHELKEDRLETLWSIAPVSR